MSKTINITVNDSTIKSIKRFMDRKNEIHNDRIRKIKESKKERNM